MKIHRALNEAFATKKFVTCAKLQQLCGIKERQMRKDIAHMRDELLLPFNDDTSKGYAYLERVDFVPHLLLSQKVCYSLLLAVKVAGLHRNDAQTRALKRTFNRITSALQENRDVDLEEMDRCMSFGTMLRPKVNPETVDFVWRCAVERIQLRVLYKTPGKKASYRDLDPYHIRKLRREWVAFCWDSQRNTWARFSIGRMSNIKTTGKTFEVSSDYSLEKALEGVMEIFQDREMTDVIIHIKENKAHIARENDVACEAGRKELPDGSIELHLRVRSFVDLLDLLRGDFGGDAVPLHPPALVDEFIQLARQEVADGEAVLAGKFRKEHSFMEELKQAEEEKRKKKDSESEQTRK